jgi:primosomal protein N' (replication factor Y)
MYSHSLIGAIRKTLAEKKQVIIYKNRRGYAPVLKCGVCDWLAECDQCDVALTYHKARNVLVCHICGSVKGIVNICPACGSPRLMFEGYGTEKIEDELSVIFPEARIKRMDLDTTRGKNNMEGLIYDFEKGEIDILVGTQMVTKGLDFDHVGLVGVIYADQALHYPDFRAAERTFQTLVQVSGRAGRKHEQGTVMIQTYQPDHPVFQDVIHGDYATFYKREIGERELFHYPPFVRQIGITIRHKQFEISREAAEMLVLDLKPLFGKRILGPSIPTIGRIRNQYLHTVMIKVEKTGKALASVKEAIKNFQAGIVKKRSFSTVRVSVDVDPSH